MERNREQTSGEPVFALVGNPNSGKTTLFNALTGLRQKVGNYSGVTVEKKEGIAYSQHGKRIKILDLPGSYSLNARSPDEVILVDALLGRLPEVEVPSGVICCVDGSNLERNLYLATQVIELGLPTVIALNMMDVAERRGIKIDCQRLEEHLGVPVIPCVSSRGEGIMEVRLALSRADLPSGKTEIKLPGMLQEAVQDLAPMLHRGRGRDPRLVEAEARLLLSGEANAGQVSPESTRVQLWQQRFDRDIPGWRSELITHRYAWIGELMRDSVKRFNPNKPQITEKIDRVLLHPVSGFIFLGLVMSLLFYSIFSLAAPLMDGIDGLISWFGLQVEGLLPAGEVRNLIVEGVIGGIGGVVIFLPQILLLFFFISLLESTGYMSRAAFILDRLMGKVGLHGRSFIPLLSAYACAVPGIMATRTIESPKDRLVTILVAPFMTCSARLPVYLVMIAALLPSGAGYAWKKAGLLLLLYVLGTVTALAFALLFRKTLFRGESSNTVMELPPYRVPQMRSILREMWDRAYIFIKRAGTIIFALSIVLWFLMNYPKTEPDETGSVTAAVSEVQMPEDGVAADEESSRGIEQSFAGRMGKALEPVFEPLGYDWKITVGIIASFAAREVFVSTMAIIYQVEDAEGSSLVDKLRASKRADGSKLFTPLTVLSILMFFVFALQCVSTIAIVRRETQSWQWPLFQFVYMFAFAWIMSFIVYQGGQLLGFS